MRGKDSDIEKDPLCNISVKGTNLTVGYGDDVMRVRINNILKMLHDSGMALFEVNIDIKCINTNIADKDKYPLEGADDFSIQEYLTEYHAATNFKKYKNKYTRLLCQLLDQELYAYMKPNEFMDFYHEFKELLVKSPHKAYVENLNDDTEVWEIYDYMNELLEKLRAGYRVRNVSDKYQVVRHNEVDL